MTYRATFIAGGELVPASRFRVHPVAGALSARGWTTRLIHGYGPLDHRIGNGALRRAYRLACRLRRAAQTACSDIEGPVLVQRLALPWLGAPEIHRVAKGNPLVFDFDDAVWLGANGRTNSLRKRALDKAFLAASHVVAGNSWLADRVNTAGRVSVIPTCIDTSLYKPAGAHREGRRPRLGWIGTSGNFPYLVHLIEPLARLRKLGSDFEFLVCSDAANNELFNRLGAKFHKWSTDNELSFLQSLDVGVMPLDDSDWCRGKCSFKMIQYMAVGCPVVASPVGMNNDVLEGDVGGRLVRNNDWVTPLVGFLQSIEQRKRSGAEARDRAVQRYDINVAIDAYRSILSALQ